MLLQLVRAIRSERLLIERLDFDRSFRWFVGPGIDEELPPEGRRRRAGSAGGGSGSTGDLEPGRNGEVDRHGEERSNATHASATDPDAMLHRKSSGTDVVLRSIGGAQVEKRAGLVVDAETTRVSGRAERMAAVETIEGVTSVSGERHVAAAADRGSTPATSSKTSGNPAPHRAAPGAPRVDERRSTAGRRGIPAAP